MIELVCRNQCRKKRDECVERARVFELGIRLGGKGDFSRQVNCLEIFVNNFHHLLLLFLLPLLLLLFMLVLFSFVLYTHKNETKGMNKK